MAPMRSLVLLALAGAALAAPDGWHRKLDDGVKASGKSGKPALVVTMWKEKV